MKFIIKDIKEKEDRNVISVEIAPRANCKTCNLRQRREGSSYCKECADMWNRNQHA